MAPFIVLIIAAIAILLALGLAYVPMRILLTQMAKRVVVSIQRERDRRGLARGTPDRRRT